MNSGGRAARSNGGQLPEAQTPRIPKPEYSLSGLPLKGRAATIELSKKLRAVGIDDPVVLFVYAEIPEPATDDRMEQKTEDIWLIHAVGCTPASRNSCSCALYKVERKRHRWTCSCPAWKKHRGKDCSHSKLVRAVIGDDIDPFSTARRRPLPRWIYPRNEPTMHTRRTHAYANMPTRVPELAEDLCHAFVRQPERKKKPGKRNGGAIGMFLKLSAYALFRKVQGRWSYDDLSPQLRGDPAVWRLGWRKAKSPCKNTLVTQFGRADFYKTFEMLLAKAARAVRRIETMGLIDATETPSIMTANARDLKFGPKPPAYRPKKDMIRTTFWVGSITNFILGADVTLNRGPGSADGLHLPSTLRKAKKAVPHLREGVADKGFEHLRNYDEAADNGVDLYIREKKNEDRLNPRNSWPPMAQRITRLERSRSPKFRNRIRYRPKAELTCSRLKRLHGYARLRKRKGDPGVQQFPELGDEQLSKLPEEAIASILEAAAQAVGAARSAEAYAALLVLSLCAHVLLEELTGQRVDPSQGEEFDPIRTVYEVEVMGLTAWT